MDDTSARRGSAPAAGLFQSLHNLFGTLVNILHTRLQLLTTELQEEVRLVARLLAWSLVAVLAVMMGLFLGALSVIFAFWETHRILAAAIMTAMFFGLALAAALVLRHYLDSKPPLLDATLSELAKDRDTLRSRL